MYTRFYHYSVKPDMKEEFLDVHQLISDIVLDSMGGRIQYLRNLNDDTQWTVMEQMESRELYEKRKAEVQDQLEEAGLPQRLEELLLSTEVSEPQEYYMFMEVQASDEY